MRVTNRYAKQTSNKEQPIKSDDGFVNGTIDGVSVNPDSKYGHPVVELLVGLKGEQGGVIKQKLFFDVIFARSSKGLTKLPMTLKKLGVMTDEEIEDFVALDGFEIEVLDDYLVKLFDLEIKYKTVLKDGKFSVDYKTLDLLSAPSSIRVLKRKTS